MNRLLHRRAVLAGIPAGLASAATLARGGQPGAASPALANASDNRHFPAQDPALVQRVVGLSHWDLDGVRSLVERQPALAKACWDWGFGDWETALGAASHTGRREIALLLIEHSARPDIFTFAMLGNLGAVRAMVEGSPGVQRLPGPHGISLLSHAVAGDEPAAAVADYLRALGDADPQPLSTPLDAEGRKVYHGRYTFGAGADELVEVADNKDTLTITRHGRSSLRLLFQGGHEFAPVGAPAARVRFVVEGGVAVRVEFHDPDLHLGAERAAG